MINHESYQFSFTWFRSGRHRQRLLPLGTLVKEGSKWVVSTEAPFMTTLDVGLGVVLGGDEAGVLRGEDVGLGDKMKGFGVKVLFLNKGLDRSLRKSRQTHTLVMPSSFFVRPLTDSTLA